MSHRILELYSGIGGMHCAWKESGLPGLISKAIDINTVANEVYQHNFPETSLSNRNIQSLTSEEIKKLNVNTILMSPPCQPFTRNGKYLDSDDPRTDSFMYLIGILPDLQNIEYILMENVKGFETSTARSLFIEKLKECNFNYQEFLLCPTAVGIPNSRLRYYCIARRGNLVWKFRTRNDIMTNLGKEYDQPYALDKIMEVDGTEKYLVPEKHLKRANLFDICHRSSIRSCCFTKAYTHYIEGTGSVFTNATPEHVKECYEKANSFQNGTVEFVKTLKPLQIRFFTPKEVLSLMAFPEYYNFPTTITIKQCFRLLGNSVNVKVISELLKLLFFE